jgi:hypothetical protein
LIRRRWDWQQPLEFHLFEQGTVKDRPAFKRVTLWASIKRTTEFLEEIM